MFIIFKFQFQCFLSHFSRLVVILRSLFHFPSFEWKVVKYDTTHLNKCMLWCSLVHWHLLVHCGPSFPQAALWWVPMGAASVAATWVLGMGTIVPWGWEAWVAADQAAPAVLGHALPPWPPPPPGTSSPTSVLSWTTLPSKRQVCLVIFLVSMGHIYWYLLF